MNERIKLLAEQAGGEFWQRIESDGVLNKEAYITFDPPESLEKFVGLIVAECVSRIGDEYADALDTIMEDWDRGYLGGLSRAIDTVQEHFEVEE